MVTGWAECICPGGHGILYNVTSTLPWNKITQNYVTVQVMEALGLTYPIFTCQAVIVACIKNLIATMQEVALTVMTYRQSPNVYPRKSQTMSCTGM